MGPSSRGANRFVFFARTHFLACEGVAGGSQQSGGNVFFAKYGGPSGGSPLSVGGIINFRVIRRHFLAATVDPAVSLSTYSTLSMESFLDHVDHAAPRAPGRWTAVRPRKGTTRSRGRCVSGRPRREEYEGWLVRLRCEAAIAKQGEYSFICA